jgi:hypothetical protein
MKLYEEKVLIAKYQTINLEKQKIQRFVRIGVSNKKIWVLTGKKLFF